jgi:hypothetical protein
MDTKAKSELSDVLAEIIKPKARLRRTKEFLGADPLHQREVAATFHIYKSALICKSVSEFLKDAKVSETRAFDWNDCEVPPLFNRMHTAVDEQETLPVKAWFFIEGKFKYILHVNFDDYSPCTGIIKVLASAEHIGDAALAIEAIQEIATKNNIYRGSILTPIGEFLPPPTVSMDDLFISAETRQAVDENIVGFLKKREVYEVNHLPFTRGVILEGSPGTGKTLLGKVLSNMKDVTFIWAPPKYMSSLGMVNNTFAMARELAPTILFLEDMDTYANQRDSVTGEILAEMDGMRSNKGIIIVATTNYPDRLDAALLSRPSRFDVRVKLGVQPPDIRQAYIDYLLRGSTLNDSVDTAALVKMTEVYNPVYIQELIRLATIIAINEGDLGADKAILGIRHFEAAAKRININHGGIRQFGVEQAEKGTPANTPAQGV